MSESKRRLRRIFFRRQKDDEHIDMTPFIRGAARLVRLSDGMVQPQRFYEKQLETLSREGRGRRAISTSGVVIDFVTDGDRLSFDCKITRHLDAGHRIYRSVVERTGALGTAEDGVVDGIDIVVAGQQSFTTMVRDGRIEHEFENPDHADVEVRVYLPISMVKKIPLTLTLVNGGGATAETTKLVIEPAEISISGSEAALNALPELNLGTIELDQITQDTTREFEINLPEGVKNVSNLSTAKVTISFPRLATREFTITEFKPLNLPAGMVWEPLTKQLTITVRGLKSEVQRLNAADILVQVDLTGVENTAAVEPTIRFPENLSSLGEVGSYSISVQITPEPPATEE
jgi:hypothetical protein